MRINKKNSEQYEDPTAYSAMVNIACEEIAKRKAEKQKAFMPLVYVCSPFSGDVTNNIKKAREYCRYTYKQGFIPLAPHLHFPQFLNDNIPKERADGLFFGIVLLNKCQELWVFGDDVSDGMKAEIQRAKSTKIPIRYFNENCKEVLKDEIRSLFK